MSGQRIGFETAPDVDAVLESFKVLWCIRKHRNKAAFEGVIEDPAQVVHAITQVPWGCHETISNVLQDWVKTPISSNCIHSNNSFIMTNNLCW